MDTTRITEGWGVGPGDDEAHLIREGEPACNSVERPFWYAAGPYWPHCAVCQRLEA